MLPFVFVLVLLSLTSLAFRLGRRRAIGAAGGRVHRLNSLPRYYGAYAALWFAGPVLVIFAVWIVFEPVIVRDLVMGSLPLEYSDMSQQRLNLVYNDVRNVASGAFSEQKAEPAIVAAAEHYNRLQSIGFAVMATVSLVLALAGVFFAQRMIGPKFRARDSVERAVRILLIASSTIAVITTLGIVLSLLFEAIRFFRAVPVGEFLFGVEWSPQTAIREDQVGSSGAFGAIPLFAGTALISLIAMCVAAPIGLMSAIFMAEYATPRFRNAVKPVLEVLAGVPTVVYGFFAALTVAPFLRQTGSLIGLDVSSESALAAGAVMGIMIIPFISSLADDAITAVPRSLREGAYGLGATKSEMIKQVLLPAALPGIVGGLLLGMSRAIGETMIVVMAAGLAANLTANPLEAVTTVTVQIVTLLTGDQEFDSAKTLSAFALGLVLFFSTLLLNIAALYIVRKYREQYE